MAYTYAQLQADIIALLHRHDLASVVPGFIARAEARLNRMVAVRRDEKETTLAGVIDSRFVTLPDDFAGPIALWYVPADEREPLPPMLPESLPIRTIAGAPEFWAIDGLNIALDKPCDVAYTLYLRHYASFALSDTVTTNWLLTEAPDVYLYASLIESAPYTMDDARLPLWQSMYAAALQELLDSEHSSKAIVPLRTELTGYLSPVRSNIFNG